MINHRPFAIAAIICSAVFLNACGSDAHGAYSGSGNIAPTAPMNIAGNAGDSAVNLGWDAPETGTQPLSYNITISPTTINAAIIRSGTHALIQGLSNDTTYTFSVTAKNNSGESSATTILLKPTALDTSNFSTLIRDTADLNSPSGIFDPSLLNEASTIWMAYSSVNYYQQSGHLVQDVSTSLAASYDSGATFTYVKTIGSAGNATITLATNNAGGNPCGNSSCTGHWVYETPFLVDDKTDSNASQRFKLFAHKYFLYPPAASATSSATFYALGAIVMWTAASPDSTWSSEQVVLSWDSTPQPLAATNNIRTINASALGECLALSEGAATSYQDALDFVFSCPNGSTQKIVMLRSSDHAKTFQYVATPLTAADAAAFGALYFSAPSLLPTESSAPVLIATPVINRSISGITPNPNAYSGCKIFPFADEEAGSLFRNNGAPLLILDIPYTTNHLNGACAWDRGVGASGILMNDFDASTNVPFSILNTVKRL